MEKLSLDTGLKQYRIGNGVLRFNPADPNLYARFLEAESKVQALEESLMEQAKALQEGDGKGAVTLLKNADSQIKQVLDGVFGGENCFEDILGGVNLLAVTANGERVITGLFRALEPILTAGARSCANAVADEAVNRAQRRRAAKK